MAKDSFKDMNWYADRYQASLVQRNLLFTLCALSVIAVIASLVVVRTIIAKNNIKPYILKEHPETGVLVHVKTEDVMEYTSAKPVIIEYFLSNYVKYRESYDKDTYEYNYGILVKAMSDTTTYAIFSQGLNNPETSPITNQSKYGSIEVSVNQVIPYNNPFVYSFRISKTSVSGASRTTKYYKADIKYKIDTADLTYSQTLINPLGIKVTAYRLTQEKRLL